MTGAGLPILKPRALIRALERMGFRLLRIAQAMRYLAAEHPRLAGPFERHLLIPSARQ